jgi:Calcineurin-like phosphoesterase
MVKPSLVNTIFFAGLLLVCSPVSRAQSRHSAKAKDQTAVLVGAGDIANCKMIAGAQATGKIIEATPGTVVAIGDLALSNGTAQEFADCYDKTWGAFKSRTRPAPGNHEFHSSGATPYFDYFGAAAGDPEKGYYSYELGAWHIIALNGECKEIGGCQTGSLEEQWLREDLRMHPAACTLAYWHEPLFSSGAEHGNNPAYRDFWKDLYNAKATIVLNGHDHDYERFAPQDPDGKADARHGIREFVVGTGGNHERTFSSMPQSNSEVRMTGTFGVLKLTLHSRSYDWQFIPEAGKSFTDSGSGACQ